jgi:2C-methyl-D-erythritol 2,4-cyclodiphosphate synthase
MALVGLTKTDTASAIKAAQALKDQEESFKKAHTDYMKGRSIEQMKAAAEKEIEAKKGDLAEQKAKLVNLNNAIQAKQAKIDNAVADSERLKAEAVDTKAKADQKLKEAEVELLKAKQKLADAAEKEQEALASKKLYEDKLEDVKKTLRALV